MLVLLRKSEVEKVVDWIVVLDVIGGDTVELVIDIVDEWGILIGFSGFGVGEVVEKLVGLWVGVGVPVCTELVRIDDCIEEIEVDGSEYIVNVEEDDDANVWIYVEVGTVVMVDFVKVDVTRNVCTIQMLKSIMLQLLTILLNLPDDVGIVLVLGKFEDDKLVGWIVDVSVIRVDSVVFTVLENIEVDSNVVKVEAKKSMMRLISWITLPC